MTRALALVLLLLAGCTQPPAACVAARATPTLVAHLFFGRDVTGRAPVSDAEWDEFARAIITPRLPDGFTVLDGNGQWLDPASGRIEQEATKILLVALPPRPGNTVALGEIADVWKTRFHQTSVGLILSPGCAAF